VARAEGLGEHLALGHPEVLPLVGVLARLPHLRDLADGLVPHGRRLVEVVDVEAVDLGRRRAATGAELEAALGDVVEQGHRLGDARRVVHLRGDVEDGRPDVHALGLGRDVRQVHLRSGHVAVLVEEVVLGAPHVLDPGAIGGHADLDVAHDALVLRHRVDVALVVGHEQLGEEAEFHARSFRRAASRPSASHPRTVRRAGEKCNTF
jgi:hypothetical protein